MQKLRRVTSSGVQQIRQLPVKAGEKLEVLLDLTKALVFYTTAVSLIFSLLFVVSAFMYGTFYFAFVPSPELEGPIFPFFEPCEEVPGKCSFVNSTLALSERNPVLMTGQPYTLSVIIEMPESPVNRQLGMFMNCVQFKSLEGKVVRERCKSAIMQYRSELLRVLETFAFLPALLTGHSTEKQFVRIEFFNDFQDDPLSPAVRLDLQLLSRYIEVYNIRFVIHANFAGLRYLMFYYPLMSAVFGVALNMVFLSAIILLSWQRFFSGPAGEDKRLLKEDSSSSEDEEIFAAKKKLVPVNSGDTSEEDDDFQEVSSPLLAKSKVEEMKLDDKDLDQET